MSNLKQLRSIISVRMLVAAILALALSAAAGAAPAEPATDDASPTAEQSTTDKGDGDEQKKAGSKDDEFIPTEEISEDFAVSFPVDI